MMKEANIVSFFNGHFISLFQGKESTLKIIISSL